MVTHGTRARWAIVGTGYMASRVADAVTGSRLGAVTAVLSRSRSRGLAFAAGHGQASVYASLDELLAADAADIVYIGSPNTLHARQAALCLAAGRHVLVDKPLATSELDAVRLCEAAAAAGLTLSTTFQNRYQPAARRVRDVLRTGGIGTVELIRITIGFGPEELTGWRVRPALAGAGAINNLGIHAYDVLRFLVGAEVESVIAMSATHKPRSLDRTMLTLLRFSDGVLAYAQVSQELSQPDVRVDILGSAGTVEWVDWMAPYRSGIVTIRSAAGIERLDSACPDAYQRLVAAFQQSVREKTVPDPSPFDALQSVRIGLAVKASARSRREVRLGV